MPDSPVLSGTTIVVVEDFPDTLFAIVQFLTRRGAKVFPRPDAFQGLQAVREHHPDIVLSDLKLPKRDGFEFLQDIRALGAENGGNVSSDRNDRIRRDPRSGANDRLPLLRAKLTIPDWHELQSMQ
jgi:CheY-like chemotaxis protein